MDNAGAPEKASKALSSLSDDIPIAFRETVDIPVKSSRNRVVLYAALGAIALVALLAGGLFSLQIRRSQNATLPAQNPDNSAEAAATTQPNASPSASPGTMLGHYAYKEAPQSDLETVEGDIKLRRSAANAYRNLVAAARQDGVNLVLISGFRSIADQQYLYFEVRKERNQNAAERAKVSAPPGYSEHHTGYAVDVGDGNVPATNLSTNFEQTAAYRWLQANAGRYSFELSFPKNNAQKVSYEPWHWRFTGDSQSLETFYKAKQK